MATKRFTGIRNSLGVCGVIVFFGVLASGEARAQSVWTHVASACAVDDGSAARYDVNAARFKVKNGVTLPATVVARCNVTNPLDNGIGTGWNYLEVAYRDPDGFATGSQVKAVLYRVNNLNGGISPLATLDSNAFGDQVDITHGVFFNRGLDFYSYAYFVEIQVKRSDTSSDPTISIVRLAAAPE